MNLLSVLIAHKGPGSLYQCLKGLNYIHGISCDQNGCCVTAMRFITMEIDLTQNGMKNYKKILAIVFEYFRTVHDDWLDPEKDRNEVVPLFKECQTIAKLSYDVYSVPD